MKNQKVYYFSISTLFVSIFLSIVFIIGIPLIVAGILFIDGGIWLSLVLIVYLFMLYISIPSYKCLFLKLKNIPAIILTENEFIDNLNKLVFKWDDIKRISYDKSNSKFKMANIYIELYESSKFTNLTGNWFDRFLRKMDNRFYKGSYRFNPNLIKGDNKDLLNELLLFKDKK
jgi:hypothetical protein